MDFFFLLTLGGRSFLEILHLPNKNAEVSVSPYISYLDLFKPTSFSTWNLSKITLQKKEKINKFLFAVNPSHPSRVWKLFTDLLHQEFIYSHEELGNYFS